MLAFTIRAIQSRYSHTPSIRETHILNIDAQGRVSGISSGDYYPSVEVKGELGPLRLLGLFGDFAMGGPK
jgi:hypothetical protein